MIGPRWKQADESGGMEVGRKEKRQGVGKMRHIHVESLWLQEKELQKVLQYQKIKGEDNPADGLTKHVRQEHAQKYSKSIHVQLSDNRAKSSLKPASQK